MSWQDVPQTESVVKPLQRSLERGRLAHAYLFAGPRGSQKEAVARELAKALNCLQNEADSCGAGSGGCESCERIDGGAHPDIYWVRPESKSRRITIDQIREFERSVSLKSAMARVKVGVIVDADCMGEEASNAFLKTLEEPPPQTVIVLLSAEPQRLLPTILSRCLKISFGGKVVGPPSPYRERVLALLKALSTQPAEKLVSTYRLLGGLNVLWGEIVGAIQSRVEAETNLRQYDDLDPRIRDRLEEQMTARVEGEYRAARYQVLEEMYGWFSDLLLQVEQAAADVLAHPDFAEDTRRSARALTYDQATANLDSIEQIRESLFRNISEALAFEVGLLKVTQSGVGSTPRRMT